VPQEAAGCNVLESNEADALRPRMTAALKWMDVHVINEIVDEAAGVGTRHCVSSTACSSDRMCSSASCGPMIGVWRESD